MRQRRLRNLTRGQSKPSLRLHWWWAKARSTRLAVPLGEEVAKQVPACRAEGLGVFRHDTIDDLVLDTAVVSAATAVAGADSSIQRPYRSHDAVPRTRPWHT